MTIMKNAEFADITEKAFGLLRVEKTTYPNNTPSLFVLRPASAHDDRECVSVSAMPYALAADLKRIVQWIEESESQA